MTILRRILRFYIEGFRSMTVGRQLWALIAVKLVLIFVVMKLLFFPNLLSREWDNDAQRAEAVRTTLLTPPDSLPERPLH